MKRLFYSLLVILVCIVIACQKDFLQSSDVAEDSEFTLATAKQHFRSLDKRLAKENPVLADPKSSELLWSRSYVEHRTDVDFAEIPLAAKQRIIALYNFPQDSLKYKPDNTISSLSTQRLLLYKGKSGEIQERIVTYIPDKEYLIRRKAEVGLNSIKKLQSDFKGYIEYRTLSGEVTLILRIENRKIVRRYRLAQAMKTVEGTVDHGNVVSTMGQNCTTICIDIAYDYCYYKIIEDELHLFCEPATKTECNTYCEDIPDPDPDPNPNPTDPDPDPEPQPEYYDCNGVRNGSAYMAECGCIGGNTGISECPSDKENDPCDAVTKANAMKNKPDVGPKIDSIKNNSTETGFKFFVGDKADYNTFYVGPGISGGSSSWSSNFTWDAANGYVVGHMHNHPQGSAPNPSDAMVGVNLVQMEASTSITTAEMNFYTKNFSAIIVTGTYVYTITIKDAYQYKIEQTYFEANRQDMQTTWLGHANDYLSNINPSATQQEAGEYALLKMYGNYINLTKQNVNVTNSNVELKLNSNNKVTSNNPC